MIIVIIIIMFIGFYKTIKQANYHHDVRSSAIVVDNTVESSRSVYQDIIMG